MYGVLSMTTLEMVIFYVSCMDEFQAPEYINYY